MKSLKKMSLPLQGFGLTAVLLLLTQSAFAIGTVEDTDVNNMATVNYDAGGVGQELIESDDAAAGGNSTPGVGNGGFTTFEVDRKIDFTLVESGNGNTIIVPDQIGAVTTFTLTNSGNDHQDFTFSASNLGGDDFDMNPGTIAVFVDANGNGTYEPLVDLLDWVDELPPDGVTTATIFIVADADSPTPVDTDLAIVQLIAVAHDGNDGAGGGQGAVAADHSGDVDDAAVVQNVFAELGLVNYDNAEEATDIYEVQSPSLNVTKTSAVIADPFSTAPNWKAIPGAVVEYTVTIENTSLTTTASNVSVSDTIDIANVTFNTGTYPNGDANITVNGVDVIAPATCIADGDASDGCTYVIGTGALVLGIAAPGVSIPAGETAVFTYSVTIN